jgi:hypothetical protein
MMSQKLKLVRALRKGSWDGHRRRAGAEFVVAESAKESWFEDVGPAPEGVELPTQLPGPQSAPRKGFVQLMQELGPGEVRVERSAEPAPKAKPKAEEDLA